MTTKDLTTTQTRIAWAAQVVAAIILLQTLFFKFTGAPESVAIFETLGAEPWGRYGTGVLELIAGIALLTPFAPVWGAVLGLGLMAGAIGSHFVFLGIEVGGDGGALFALAVTVFVSCAVVVTLRRHQIRR